MEPRKKQASLRDSMPETALWVDEKRKTLGVEYVNGCIKDALSGVPGRFYAMENGHVLGTPFPAESPVAKWQQYAVINGCKFSAFIETPEVTA